ncbi:MAG TPA: hypothetical protein VFT45_24865 [Longimicrobium sp.]|nr:hypothetical protein [Longimicrobium sp.]
MRGLLLTVLALAVAGCADASGPGVTIGEVRIVAQGGTLATGDTARLTVRVYDENGALLESIPRGKEPVFTTSDPAVLESRDGRIIAVGPGQAEVTASIGTVSGSVRLFVNPRILSLTPTVILNQVVQNLNGSVLLLAGKPGLLQVFVTADQLNYFARPVVRVRLFHGDQEVLSTDLRMEGQGIEHLPLQNGVSASMNLHVPGELVRPGLGVLLEMDPDGTLPLASRVYPASGAPQRFLFGEVPPLHIRFVPIHHEGRGTGNVTPENVNDYLGPTRVLHPMEEIDPDVRAPYSAQANPDAPNYYVDLVFELAMVRVADGSSRHYYGIAQGTSGRSLLGSPVAVSWDLPGHDAAVTVAHELGHNFGRLHAGVCRVDDPYLDKNYPYAQGSIGTYGYDAATRTLYRRGDAFDIMGRCGTPDWVSDYTYANVFHFRRFPPSGSGGAASRAARTRGPALLVWGGVDGRGVRLEPAFEVETVPTLPGASGAYTLQGRDDDGALLFSYSFDPVPVEDEPAGAGSFAFAVPLDFPVERLASLRVAGRGRAAESRSVLRRTDRLGLRASVAPVAGERASRASGGGVEVRWDATRHRAALVVDPRTSQVLGFARSGVARVRSDAPELELRLSDGVSSVVRRVRVR